MPTLYYNITIRFSFFKMRLICYAQITLLDFMLFKSL